MCLSEHSKLVRRVEMQEGDKEKSREQEGVMAEGAPPVAFPVSLGL